MNKIFTIIAFVLSTSLTLQAQENYKTISSEDNAKYYPGGEPYDVEYYKETTSNKKPKNVILLIGDGMGVNQIYAGITANLGEMYIQNFKKIGFQTTYSANNYTTDSAASGTALSTGNKTYNGAIGVDTDTVAIENIREKFEKQGMATGVVSSSSITHATPAAFVAHQPQRSMYEAIAADFLETNIDVFIGGGYKHFTDRKDSKNLVDELKKKGYQVETEMKKIAKTKKGKLAGLVSSEHPTTIEDGRGDMLIKATETAINILDNDPDGFFLMVEGSQIDWAGHQHNTSYLVTETHDFDKTVGKALAFAAKNKETLVIVTSDHETGGFAINNGNIKTGEVLGEYTTGGHTGVMMPVFAFGPGSDEFTGFYDNTDIPKKIEALLKN
ncbi:MAG: alkaline phosphatase [Prolixibacteraceae bacterium]|nr:alkaline phosphatase [Prolixibacteraceae bacterium]